jgi:hypothetical protein
LSVTSSEPARTPGKVANLATLTRFRSWLTRSVTKPRTWIALAVLVPVMVGLAGTGTGQSLLRSAGLAAPPASYVALSFQDPQALPARIASPYAAIHVSFVVHNVSASPAARMLHWSIRLSKTGSRVTAAAGRVLVLGGAERTVTATVLAFCVGGRLQLVVQLARPAESIDYWMACPAARSAVR